MIYHLMLRIANIVGNALTLNFAGVEGERKRKSVSREGDMNNV